MHPRSKQWHLLDYIIVRKSQACETLVTRAMRGAECWTDHRLILAKMRLRIRPRTRRTRAARKLDCSALKNAEIRNNFERKVAQITQDIDNNLHASSLNEKWDSFASRLLKDA